jgi:addiction module HigA family antidote
MSGNPLLKGLRPVHPGESLRVIVLPALGKPKAEIARLLGVSRQTLYDVLNEKQPITANLALRIGKLVGGGAEVWLRMQLNYDLEMAERALAKELKHIPTLAAAAE